MEVDKIKGEKKDAFAERMEKIGQFLEGYFDSSDSKKEEGGNEIPDMIIKPSTDPMGYPVSIKPAKIPKPKPAKKFCTNCGQELPPGGTFCANCGTKME